MGKTEFFWVKTHHFPHISRLFTAYLVFGLYAGLVFGVVLLTVVAYPGRLRPQINPKTASFTARYESWKQIVSEKGDYRDGFVMLAWYAEKLGKTDEARGYLVKVKELDPAYAIPEIFSSEVR